MFYPTKKDDVKEVPVNTEKYSKITLEIERFIEERKKKPTTFKGIVEKVDLNNNVITIKLQSPKQPNLSRGSLILIREDSPSSSDIRATTKGFYNSNLKLEIKTNPSQFENKTVVIDIEKTNVILERLKNIVENIKKGKINLDNVKILDFMIGENKPHHSQERISFISKKLNKDQEEGVMNSIKTRDFHLIIGPPGTGKTYVIEELIRQFTKRNQKLLVTAWTNLAVDNIIKRLSRKETKNIVRIGPINEIDLEVRKFSIFEKMKEHEDWKEVEKYHKMRDGLFKIIPRIKDEISWVQGNINQSMDKTKVLEGELNRLLTEKQRYEEIISMPIAKKSPVNIFPVNNEIYLINKESEAYLSLSKNIFQLNGLQSQIPGAKSIKDLKKLTRSMKFSIMSKKVSSFFSKTNIKELEKLKQEYERNRKYLDEVSELQKKYDHLKIICEKEFDRIYSSGDGSPDKDALNLEFRAYEILEDKYLPILKEQEMSNMTKRTSEVNQEVYGIYVDSLNKKIDLLNVKIKSLNTELYIQINHKKDLHRQYANLSSSLDFYKKNADKIMKAIISDIINKADLIAATAISSCHPFLDDTGFDVMIMDESTQVASFMSLLPLLKCKKFILVGDNKQLQPIEEENISKEMNLSIFNRLFEMYPEASTFLSTQYRMHKSIAQIANEIFYEGKLKTSEKIAERILNLKIGGHQFLNPKIPVMFIDTSKAEYYEDEVGSGCSNTKEAKYVAYIVSLFIKKGIKTADIGVVTPYVKQKFLIEDFLKDIKLEGVEANTVHKFQGREKDIIIMSFARSKKYSFPQYKLNFIENETLVNVAITRARKKLILVGNSGTLCQSKLLNKVINKIGDENSIIL
ncbi:MAG: AAA domain-containing protein [Candidatus Woesearchaeota archaeon]|nr:AAA domain-containing protein [Candidatus Woesearchaeota archaeon]